MVASRGQGTAWPALAWLLVLAACLIQMLVVSPGRGAGLTEDDGYFLTVAWHAANGLGLDGQLPQTTHYLVHAALMKLGLREVLHFRWFNHALSALSATVFFLSLAPQGWRAVAVPLAVACSVMLSLYSIQGPNTLVLAFFLLGAGLTFMACDRDGGLRHGMLAAAGGFLALSAFMHAAVTIAMTLYVALLLALVPTVRRSALPWVFVVGTVALWAAYLRHLGLDKFLHTPFAHDASSEYLMLRVLMIVRFYWECLAAFLFLLCPLAFLRIDWSRRFALVQAVLCVGITGFFLYCLAFYLLQYVHGVPVAELAIPVVNVFDHHTMYLLTDEAVWISRIPGGLSFFVMVFVMIRLLATNAMVASTMAHGDGTRRVVRWCVACLGPDSFRLRWVLAFIGLALITAATGVGSNTAISQGMTFFAGPAFGLTILVWFGLDGRPRALSVAMAVVFLGVSTTFALAYNHSANYRVVSTQHQRLDFPPFTGLMETPAYVAAINDIRAAYVQQHCADLQLATLDYMPFLYYVFAKPIPPGVGIPRPVFGFDGARFQSGLPPAAGWCVFDVTSRETAPMIKRTGTDLRAGVRQWLKETSDRRVQLPSPEPDVISGITLYVRDRRP